RSNYDRHIRKVKTYALVIQNACRSGNFTPFHNSLLYEPTSLSMENILIRYIVRGREYIWSLPPGPRAIFLIISLIAIIGLAAGIAYLAGAWSDAAPTQDDPPTSVIGLSVDGLPSDKTYTVYFQLVDKLYRLVSTDGTAKLTITDPLGALLYNNTFSIKKSDFDNKQFENATGVILHVPTSDVQPSAGRGTAVLDFTTADGRHLLP